jgi:hypothetical protein
MTKDDLPKLQAALVEGAPEQRSTEARCAVSTGSAGWVRGEAPKDGNLYVAMGRMVGFDEWGGHSTPFLSQVRWHCDADWGGWVDERGLAVSSDIDDRVHIDHWCALPNNGHEPTAPSAPKLK